MPADVLESRQFPNMPRETIEHSLKVLHKQLTALVKKVNKMHADIQKALDDQGVEIARTQSLEVTNKALLEGLNAQIQSGGNPAEIAGAINTKTAGLKTANDATEADIRANSPA